MSGNRRIGNAAEAFVAGVLAEEHPDSLVIPLQQDYGADLAQMRDYDPQWRLIEVKSAKTRSRALKAPLTPAEKALQARLGARYVVVRVWRHPGRPKDTFEVLSRGA